MYERLFVLIEVKETELDQEPGCEYCGNDLVRIETTGFILCRAVNPNSALASFRPIKEGYFLPFELDIEHDKASADLVTILGCHGISTGCYVEYKEANDMDPEIIEILDGMWRDY